jgi:hypothetical protein
LSQTLQDSYSNLVKAAAATLKDLINSTKDCVAGQFRELFDALEAAQTFPFLISSGLTQRQSQGRFWRPVP